MIKRGTALARALVAMDEKLIEADRYLSPLVGCQTSPLTLPYNESELFGSPSAFLATGYGILPVFYAEKI